MDNENLDKVRHGLSAEQSLHEIIKDLKTNGFVVDYRVNYRVRSISSENLWIRSYAFERLVPPLNANCFCHLLL